MSTEAPLESEEAHASFSVRSQLSRAMLLVLLIALLPSIVAIQYLRSVERVPPASAQAEPGAPGAEEASGTRDGGPAFSDRAVRNTITFAILAAFAGGLVVVYAPVTLLKALGRVTSILKQAEAGNLNVAVAGSRIREVSALAVAVNRTLGRLRHFDALKTRRIREEQRLVEALFATNGHGLALVSPQAKIVRRNVVFRELVERGGGDCSGRSVRDILGAEAHEAVRRVQRDRDVATLEWAPGGEETSHRVTFSPVKDEVDAPPRVLVSVEPAGGV